MLHLKINLLKKLFDSNVVKKINITLYFCNKSGGIHKTKMLVFVENDYLKS